jgi:abortive infection bacteriophage resistance protein
MGEDKQIHALKKPTTYQEQIEILRSRGLIIEDENHAIEMLKRVSYYRLTAYGLSLKQENSDDYLQGVSFELIHRLYEFDSKLRVLIMAISEQIEIAFRSQIAYYIAHTYGELGYRNSNNFNCVDTHSDFLLRLDKLLLEAKELFVFHHQNKYGGQFPVWVAFEVMTFGMLSTLYKNLKTKDKKNITRMYYKDSYFGDISSWLYSISVLRNRCAHFNRIYNKSLSIAPRIPKEAENLELGRHDLLVVIYAMKKLMTNKASWLNWVIELQALLEAYPEVDIRLMGFKENWHEILTSNSL